MRTVFFFVVGSSDFEGAAWEVLSNEDARKRYDEWLEAGSKWDERDNVVFYGEPRELEANWVTSAAIIFVCVIPLMIPFCADGRRGKKSRWSKFVAAVESFQNRIFPPKKAVEEPRPEPRPRPPREPKLPMVEPTVAKIEPVSFIPVAVAPVDQKVGAYFQVGTKSILLQFAC